MAKIREANNYDYQTHLSKAIDICPDGSLAQQTAIALALKAMYMQGRADEAVEQIDNITWD